MSTITATEFDTYVVKVPKALSKMFEKKRMAGVYSKSEALRDAIRDWAIPTVEPTREEIKAIERGRKEYERGEYVTLAELNKEFNFNI